MTGLWQVSGRNRVSYERRVQLDDEYVRSRSVWLDCWILVKTVLVVVTRDGAS
jgi:exopolysaccharide production protein ExoY